MKEITIVASGNWGTAIARIVGDNVPKLDKLDETLKMYVLEEKDGDRKLSEITNTTHESIKNLPDFKIPENVMKSADDLGVRCNGDPHHEPAYRTLSSGHSPNSSSHYDSLRRQKHSTSFEQENPSPIAKGEGLYSTGSVYSQPETLQRPPMLERAPEYMDMTITLLPQENRFGFCIVGGTEEESQVAIAHVVPGGAADLDGRMQTGDEIVSVDNQMVLNASHRHVVNLIGNSANNGKLTLGLRRRVSSVGEASQKCQVQQQLIQDLLQENDILRQYLREPDLPDLPEILTFRIPLTDGLLGVSVQGRRTSTANGSRDLGIFIKTMTPGGAASKDGRLQANDRIVSINGISLRGMSESCAVETLRAALTKSSVLLTVERITGQVGEHCKLLRADTEEAQGPGLQEKQRIRDEASESSFGRSNVYLTLISLHLVLIFLLVINISKDVFTHKSLYL